jgi:hypothetical protein
MELKKEKLNLELMHGVCPACGSRIDRGVVVCIRCGLNVRTGKQIRTKAQTEPRRWGRIVVFLLFVGFVAGAVAVVPRTLRWYEDGLCNLAQERNDKVHAYVNQFYPVCMIGETVTVRSATGGTIVGVLLGSGQSGIIMQSKQGRMAVLPLHLFDPAELIRFDEILRQDVLRKTAELPGTYWRRLLLLLYPQELNMDIASVVKELRSFPCDLCHGTGVIPCAQCAGRGTLPTKADKTCQQCDGTGMYAARLGAGKTQCPFCHGMGTLPDTQFSYCAACEGTGKVPCSKCVIATQ